MTNLGLHFLSFQLRIELQFIFFKILKLYLFDISRWSGKFSQKIDFYLWLLFKSNQAKRLSIENEFKRKKNETGFEDKYFRSKRQMWLNWNSLLQT